MKQLLVLCAAVAATSSFAQVSFTGSYFQNFDSMAASGSPAWTPNLPTAQMPGWYSSEPTYTGDNGSSGVPGVYSYGPSALDRALGSVSLPGAWFIYALRLNNATSNTITSVTLNYNQEQWRSGSATPETVNFGYSTAFSTLFGTSWNAHAALDLNAVDFTAAGAINGNANQVVKNSTINGLNWTPGTDLWVSWSHIGNGSNHGLANDDFHLQANPVPEPFTMTLAAAGLVAAVRRRRR